ncbi:MAG: alpha/beta hydrolase, partial [Acidimicrobiales bacterium]|nr:alpha/beta hydrolase [Acidimicrobiales bacterium]
MASSKNPRRNRPAPRSSAENRRAGRQFLAASALGALNTANARTPIARQGGVSIPSFFSGWLTSEMPLHAIGWQALSTVAWARRGALRTPAGIAALGINAASWVALARIWKEAMSQDRILDAALTDAFGEDFEGARLVEPNVTRKRVAKGPLTQWKRRYVNGPALSYGDAGRRNQLDIWSRPDLPTDAKAPVLLQVHGGGWIIGNKDQQAMPLMAHLVDCGWVCVSINYRLSPRATWPDHIVDVKRALAWIKDNIADYGGDPDFVAITGGSAGGHLCSLAALTPNEPEFQPGFEDKDTSVVAAVPFYGVYDFLNRDGTGRDDMEQVLADFVLKSTPAQAPQLWDHASTMSWVNADAPPFFVLHGTNDSLVPVEQARSFVSMLREVSKEPVAYAELPGAQHAFEVFDSPRTIYSAGAVHRFLETVRARAGHGVEPADSTRRAHLAVVPEDRRIKGTTSMKYHVPGSQWYDR